MLLSEWWSYRPSDFLMFSARSYGRMVEQYNREWWPLHAAALLAGGLLLWWATSRPRESARLVLAVLAIAWGWVGWAFHAEAFAGINTGAPYFAAAFCAQAALLLLALAWHRGDARALPGEGVRRTGLALAIAGILLYPLLALVTGDGAPRAEVFGLMPEPTALATLGLLLATPQRGRGVLLVLPVLSLALGATTAGLLATA